MSDRSGHKVASVGRLWYPVQYEHRNRTNGSELSEWIGQTMECGNKFASSLRQSQLIGGELADLSRSNWSSEKCISLPTLSFGTTPKMMIMLTLWTAEKLGDTISLWIHNRYRAKRTETLRHMATHVHRYSTHNKVVLYSSLAQARKMKYINSGFQKFDRQSLCPRCYPCRENSSTRRKKQHSASSILPKRSAY